METQNETRNVAQIILHAIDAAQHGKHKLARLLKGSRSRETLSKMQEGCFGSLFWHTVSTIEGFIEQLERMNLIARKVQYGYPYPYSVYALTEAGKEAMNEKIEILLQEIKKQEPITVGDSEKQTFEMFKLGKTVSDIAKERDLATSTIYTHFYRLIVNGYLEGSEVIPKDVYEIIKDACARFEKQPLLKRIKELLPPEITYEQIRCVAGDIFRGEHGSGH